ncbi:MAG: glycosyltransferase family 2 protein [Deinococcales bacterium]
MINAFLAFSLMEKLLFILAMAHLMIQLLTLLSNLIFFPSLRPQSKLDRLPKISILIPARNEAQNLPQSLPSILRQAEAYEIIVLDDESQDETWQILEHFAKQDPRLKLLKGKPLPKGWLGKNWACQQLAEVAQGDILIFSDADVLWQAGSLRAIVSEQLRHQADIFSVWPRQITLSFFERLSVPQVDMILLGLLPYLGVRYLPFAAFAAANGQLISWRRSAYQQFGGHAVLKAEVLEDVRMAQRAKGLGFKLSLALGGELLATRMYHSPKQVMEGFSKNILAAHSHSRLWLIASLLLVGA